MRWAGECVYFHSIMTLSKSAVKLSAFVLCSTSRRRPCRRDMNLDVVLKCCCACGSVCVASVCLCKSVKRRCTNRGQRYKQVCLPLCVCQMGCGEACDDCFRCVCVSAHWINTLLLMLMWNSWKSHLLFCFLFPEAAWMICFHVVTACHVLLRSSTVSTSEL